jgi:predicted molibdopterin-dependent oxidoreductase YjgC
MEDWQILVNLATALGVRFDYASTAHVRADIAEKIGVGFEGLTTLAFATPVTARHWLQANNPSERWKWDFMFQDLPPVKGAVDAAALPGMISLREVK